MITEIVPVSTRATAEQLTREAFGQHVIEHGSEPEADQDALREIRYLASYPRLWGAMQPIGDSYRAGGWAWAVGWLLAMAYFATYGLQGF